MALDVILVLVFVLFPGLLADALYRFGASRPKPTDQASLVRAAVFSAAALVLLLIISSAFNTNLRPIYLDPGWWKATGATTDFLSDAVMAPWMGHFGLSVLLGLGLTIVVEAEWFNAAALWVFGRTPHASFWEAHIHQHLGHRVVVRLEGGGEVSGELGRIAPDGTGDIVLFRPCAYNGADSTITVSADEVMYIPRARVFGVTVPLPEQRLREVPNWGKVLPIPRRKPEPK